MRTLLAVIDKFNANLGKITSFILLPTIASIYYEVVCRYALGTPTLWASELTTYFCGILYILGAAWTMQVGRHVKIDMVWARLSTRGKRVLDLVTFPFFALYICFFLWVGFRFAMESLAIRETSGTPWDPPIYPFKMIFVIGTAMLLLQGFAKVARDIHFLRTGEEL